MAFHREEVWPRLNYRAVGPKREHKSFYFAESHNMEPGCWLLLVDDDDEFLEILVRRFSRRGMQVAGAASAQAAIDAAGRQEFQVAVVDRSLPGQDGVELMVCLHRCQPDLRVILLSGHGDEPDISEARARGAFDYLVKPCSLADLEAAVIRAYRSLGHGGWPS